MTAVLPEPSPLAELPTMPLSAPAVILPGLLSGLGLTDYQQSIESGLTESFEDFCERISKAVPDGR